VANLNRIRAVTPDVRICVTGPIIRFGGDDDGGEDRDRAAAGERRADRDAPHVLIVEDELFVAWHIEDLVQSLDHYVCGLTARGEEALEAARSLLPDLVLMDINLGGEIDGVETARRIREVEHIPIVFITAYSDSGTAERARRAVPSAIILHKPVTAQALRRAIGAVLKPPN
jgi:CheY-like chemotaxis protein